MLTGALVLVGVVAAVASLALLAPGAVAHSSMLRDALHAPGFCILSGTLAWIFRARLGIRHAYLAAGGLAVAAGMAVELLQAFGPGDPSWFDLANDVLGAASGLVMHQLIARRRSLRRARFTALLGLAAVLLTFTMYPLAVVSHALFKRTQAVPMLASFDAPWEARLYSGPGGRDIGRVPPPPDWPKSTGRVAVVELDRPRQAGFNLHDVHPDWSGFRSLRFVAASLTGETLQVRLRIHDRGYRSGMQDRYFKLMEIGPSPREFVIPISEIEAGPATRRLDLREINNVLFYKNERQEGAAILLDDVRLAR